MNEVPAGVTGQGEAGQDHAGSWVDVEGRDGRRAESERRGGLCRQRRPGDTGDEADDGQCCRDEAERDPPGETGEFSATTIRPVPAIMAQAIQGRSRAAAAR